MHVRRSTSDESQSTTLGPVWIVGLALLGVPRAVAHDLDLVGPVVNGVLVFLPIAIWLGVVLWRRVSKPFLTLVAVGIVYGVLLGIVHQVFWTESFDGDAPSLGGNLAGALSPMAEAIVLRVFAFFSSLLTGLGVGAATGAVGWVLARLVWRR
jgi:hypothetical protein